MSKVELEILEFSKVAGRNIVAIKILSGEPSGEMDLQSETNGKIWKVKGSAFLPAEKWAGGLRGLILEGENESITLKAGEKLISQS